MEENSSDRTEHGLVIFVKVVEEIGCVVVFFRLFVFWSCIRAVYMTVRKRDRVMQTGRTERQKQRQHLVCQSAGSGPWMQKT